MNKNAFAPTPPMGWNSYDYYDTTVKEAQVRANAAVLAEKLKEYGWEYVVVDIEWYAHKAGSMRDKFQYIPFGSVEMDGYSRLLPDPERFPVLCGRERLRPAGGVRPQPGAEIRRPYHAGHPPRRRSRPYEDQGQRSDGGHGGGPLVRLPLEPGHVRRPELRGGSGVLRFSH